MNLKIAKMICNLQKINMRIRVKAFCPNCEKRTLTMMPEKDKAKCSKCKQTWTMMEILRLCNEEELAKHRRSSWESKNNKGVKQ